MSMALSEEIKKGGRYTKKEQEERRLQVYHLHFEQEKPAVKIAELLNVNRNTINDDIRYWHQQLASEESRGGEAHRALNLRLGRVQLRDEPSSGALVLTVRPLRSGSPAGNYSNPRWADGKPIEPKPGSADY